MADLSEAFKITTPLNSYNYSQHVHHSNVTPVKYLFKCVFCNSTNVFALTSDGGSSQLCRNCGRAFRADKINPSYK